jgi:predicted lipoprotein
MKRRPRLWVLAGGLVLAAACSRTTDPLEHYASENGRAGGGAGDRSSAQGGRAPVGQAGSVSVHGGRAGSAAAGGGTDAVALAGQGGDGDVGPLPPSDFGCGEPPVSTEAFSRRALRAAAAECAKWHYCRFESGARAFSEELADYATAPTPEGLARSQAAFATAFDLASVDELFQFGPLASQAESAGKDSYQGKGLRELIYAWPLSARCRVEEQVVQRTYEQNMKGVLVNGRGLFALDYLLFYPGNDTECTPNSTTGKAWPTLTDAELAAGKLDYALALGDDMVRQAQALQGAWAADGGNFTPVFVDATGYPSEHEAMKVLSWALLYIEREVKDWKLGLPAGHTATAPVSVAEAAFSGLQTEAVRQNLRGFRGLFQGCGADGEGLGFDDWLTEAGHGELAQDILSAYAAAQAAADAAPPFGRATPQELEDLYQVVKHLTDLLKNDLFGAGSPLGLTLPKGIEGDTD